MRRTGVHLEHLFHLLARERRFREHPPHRFLDHALRVFREQALERREPLVPHVTGVVEVLLLVELAPGESDALGVHHYDAIATVHVRRERGLVLAAQNLRHAAREPAERLPGGVHHEPAAIDVRGFEREGFHEPRTIPRAVRPCQPEGSTLSTVTSGAPFSTAATCTFTTTPARGARSWFSIFIASTTTSSVPAATCWPSVTATRTTRPGMGACTIPDAARTGRRPVSSWIRRVRSSTASTSMRSPTTPSVQRPIASPG